ncbi:unnamed protein product [Paramecium pentaurelia]|uniref:MORN repeat protein n=1 Tax=Paramecium pentaurelia TaxID=43138 RepID=A0A8S1VFC6_9CILI|nr:unnamed protein product [Paramecium pentaurelia]
MASTNQIQKDRYKGEFQPLNKVRHGFGTYIYENSFFTYEGQWENGIKQGQGILKMKDGSYYQGNFEKGEIEGHGEFHYANGSMYVGEFHQGEKHGQGVFSSANMTYEGQWSFNCMQGSGILQTPIYRIEGTFLQHKPHGHCNYYSEEYNYIGEFDRGKRSGKGKYESKLEDYEGEFLDDKKHGPGILVKKGENPYYYAGEFLQDNPTLQANKLNFKLDPQPEEPIDPKAKKGEPVIDLTQVLVHELKSGKTINFELQLVYQGPDIEDPVQPTQQEIDEMVKNWQKEAKKQKNPPPMPDFGAKRMIPAPPIHIKQESGRLLELKMIQKTEQGDKLFRIDYREKLAVRREEVARLKAEIEAQKQLEEQQAQQPVKKKDAKKQAKKQPEPDQIDLSVKLYVEGDNESLIVETKEGMVRIENLEYPEDFPPGKYYYVISNKSTNSIGEFVPIEIEVIINPEGGLKQQPKKK